MKSLFTSISFIISIFCLSQCSFQSDEQIEIPQSNPELAVYADLSNDNGFSAYVVRKRVPNEPIEWDVNFNDSIVDIKTNKAVYTLYQSTIITGRAVLFDYVKDAKVIILEDGKFLTELKPEFYPLPHYVNYDKKLIAGKKYQIEVTASKYPKVTGEQTALSDILADNIEYRKNSYQSRDNGLLSELFIRFKDPVGESNSYLTIASLIKTNRKNGKIDFQKIPLYKTDPTSTTNNIISDRSFNGENYSWRLGANIEPYLVDTVGTDIQLEVNFFPINNDLEKYFRTLEFRDANYDNPFTEPVTPYYNVKGGLGIFSTSGKSTSKSFIIK
jgi:Domain of unknown function (DUF4249)